MHTGMYRYTTCSSITDWYPHAFTKLSRSCCASLWSCSESVAARAMMFTHTQHMHTQTFLFGRRARISGDSLFRVLKWHLRMSQCCKACKACKSSRSVVKLAKPVYRLRLSLCLLALYLPSSCLLAFCLPSCFFLPPSCFLLAFWHSSCLLAFFLPSSCVLASSCLLLAFFLPSCFLLAFLPSSYLLDAFVLNVFSILCRAEKPDQRWPYSFR